MGGHDQLQDDGRNRTHGRQDEAASPLAEGGEKAPGTPPATRKDDSVEIGGDEVDPSVSHGGAASDTDDPDAR